MDMMHSCHPHCHIHEMEMMDHVKRSIAASYTSLLSRLDSHIEDNRVHVSCEEKDTWNNKADKTQIRDLEMRLTEKADYCDVIELKEILAKIKAKVDNTSESSSDGSDYITENELERILKDLKEEVTNNIIERIETEGLGVDLSNYYTKDEVDAKISQGGGQGTGTVTVSYRDNISDSATGRYRLGTLTINSQSIDIYGKDNVADIQSGEGGGTTVIENDYDDWEIKQQIQDVKDRLDELFDDVKDEVEKNINDMLDDEELIKKLFPNGGGGWSNFGQELDSYLDKYLLIIGYYDEHGTAKWSKIEQELQTIRAKVASIDPDAEGNYDALLAQLRLDILEDGALAELLTQYTKLNDAKKILSWLYSGLKSGTNESMTWADLISAAGNGVDEAIANIHTQVQKLENGEYVSTADLDAKMNEKMAGLAAKADVDEAFATLFAEDGDLAAFVRAKVADGVTLIDITADDIDIDGLIRKINAQNATINANLRVGGDTSYIEVSNSQDKSWGYIKCVGPNSSTYISSSTTGSGYTDINGGWVCVSDSGDSTGADWTSSTNYSWMKPGEVRIQGRTGYVSVDANTVWGDDHNATVVSVKANAIDLNDTKLQTEGDYGQSGTFTDGSGRQIVVKNGLIVRGLS